MTGPAGPGATFVKRRSDAPPGFFAAEAAGLRWLAQARLVHAVLFGGGYGRRAVEAARS